MNKTLFIGLALLTITAGCRQSAPEIGITSMQVVDRNGFSETISTKERLEKYEGVNFLTAQPYEKVLRIFKKDQEGKSPSKLTSYHANGGVWQYLEAIDGRAHGKYLEWHENGKLKIEVQVIDGMADLSQSAQKNWLFDGECKVFDEKENIEAFFTYERGYLVDEAIYYHPNGQVKMKIPYKKNVVEGELRAYDTQGNLIESTLYKNGLRDGSSTCHYTLDQCRSQEQFREGLLMNGIYFNPEGEIVSEVENGQGVRSEYKEGILHQTVEYVGGSPHGKISTFLPNGSMINSYCIVQNQKTGTEWDYYPSTSSEQRPKLMVEWVEDRIQGMVKTWYENGTLESQREMANNKKHGLHIAYFQTGELMLMEDYDEDKLSKGSYYKKGEKEPVSIVEKGEGTATLFTPSGHFLKKITYERGKPVVE